MPPMNDRSRFASTASAPMLCCRAVPQTCKVMVPKTSNAVKTYTDSPNVQHTLALTSTDDAPTFINSCLQ